MSGSPLWGGWFGQIWIGGTNPLDAPLWVDNQGIIQVGGIAARQGSQYPYISVRNKTGLEMGRIGASLNVPSGSVGDNVGGSPPAQLTDGAWFTQLAVGGSNLSNWNMLIVPDTTRPLGSQFLMRNVALLSIDYPASQGTQPSNAEYKLEFGADVWMAGGLAGTWRFPGIHIYEVDQVGNNFGATFLNRGVVLRGPQRTPGFQTYPVIASLVTFNGQSSGSDIPSEFWGELTMYSPRAPYTRTVYIASGSATSGSPSMMFQDVSGNILYSMDTDGNVYIKGRIQGMPVAGTGASTPLIAYALNVAAYGPVIDAAGNWVGKPIAASGGQTPWTQNIDGAGFKLSGAGTISAAQFALNSGTVLINTSGHFVGLGVDVGQANHVYAGYVATNQHPGGANQIDTGTLNCSGTITCNTFSTNVFSPASIDTPGDVRAGGVHKGGRFEGAGVWCPGDGIRCGSLTVANASGAGQPISCGSISVGAEVNCVSLQIKGTQRIDSFGIYRGSVQVNDHVFGSNFGIQAVVEGWDGSFYDRDGVLHVVRGGIITQH
jgi:hypothetical protein